MAIAEKLFTVPPQPVNVTITCTQPASRIYLLTFNAPPDNRLNTEFCQALLLALDIIELRYPKGVVITTSAIEKFYSNGLDLASATSTPNFFPSILYLLWRRILTYPMPTIALINGHAFAGALMLAMMHDYRIMNPHRGYLCLNELELGVPLRPPMSSIFRQKVPSPATYRSMVLEAQRFKALGALKEGIVDGLGGLPETLAFVEEMKFVQKAQSPVYGELKAEMWRETVAYLDEYEEELRREERQRLIKQKLSEASEERVRHWESQVKAKL